MLEARLIGSFIPDPDPSWGTDPLPFALLMLAGFLVGTAGHIYKSKVVIVLGISMIFLATFALPLGVYLSRS